MDSTSSLAICDRNIINHAWIFNSVDIYYRPQRYCYEWMTLYRPLGRKKNRRRMVPVAHKCPRICNRSSWEIDVGLGRAIGRSLVKRNL